MIEANIKSSSGNIHTYILFSGNYRKTASSVPPPSSEHGGRENFYTVALLNELYTKP
jgi:hypothetical protein